MRRDHFLRNAKWEARLTPGEPRFDWPKFIMLAALVGACFGFWFTVFIVLVGDSCEPQSYACPASLTTGAGHE